MTETLLDTSTATHGGMWLTWSRAMERSGSIGLPDWLAQRLVARLVSELARSVSHGYPARYEALARLRCSPYGSIVLEVAKSWMADPHVQVLYDLMSGVGEEVTTDGVEWCTQLLLDPRDRVVIGAALALENMAQIGRSPGFWGELVRPLSEMFDEAEEHTVRWEWVSHLLRLVPREVAQSAGTWPLQPLAPKADVSDWSRTRRNRHWEDCDLRAAKVASALGLGQHAMLARLLFDIAINPLESRAVTSYMLIGALPEVAELVGEQLSELIDDHEDPVIRRRAARRLPGTLHGAFPDIAHRWLSGEAGDLRNRAVLMSGAAGVVLGPDMLEEAVRNGSSAASAALYAAGMTAHPILQRWRVDADPSVLGGAEWWLRQGSRLVR